MEQVEKMQEALAKLVDEAGARTREEVDNVKKTVQSKYIQVNGRDTYFRNG